LVTTHLTQAQLEYAAHDAVTTLRLSRRVLPALGAQTPAYEVQINAVPAAARMQHRGVRLDLDAHSEFIRAKRERRIETCAAYQAACREMGLLDLAASIPATPAAKRTVLETILSSDQLRTWKRTEKSGVLSTAGNELKRVAAEYGPIGALVELSKIDKVLTSFGPTLAALVSPITGRIHAHYRVASTASGRASCSYPNLQQAPRDKEFRALFRAAPGHKYVGGDFSGMELRAAAHIAPEPALIEAFAQGRDPHRITAARMLGKPENEITDDERARAKPVNFGSLYGLGPSGLIVTAWDEYEIVLTAGEAEEWIDAVRRAYPRLNQWRYDHYRQCERAGEIVIGRDAKRGIGRFYPLSRLPKGARNGYTRCCNLPIQGACGDASMLALAAIDDALFEAGIEGGPVLWLHDEIILEVPEADAEQAKQLLEQTMVDAFEQTFPGSHEMGLLNGLVDAHIGDNWTEAKEKPKPKKNAQCA
jgi:DNA polymerase I